MKKYLVTVNTLIEFDKEIEAKDKEEAERKAYDFAEATLPGSIINIDTKVY